jgi:lipopolysaccharide/colanic/teichoic acid biosynthesis glycosyltransferase
MSSKQFAISFNPSAAKDQLARRRLDIVGAVGGLIILSPLLAGLGLAVRLTSLGPALYRAQRVGQHGRLFSLYKFRTMVMNADRLGPGITAASDSRITGLGRWLRRFKLDELPQLINVLKGEMALVGPRPEDPRYVAHFTAEQRQVLTVLPGLTSPASLQYRTEEQSLTGPDWEQTYLTLVLPDKLHIEIDYLHHRTLWSDLIIIWQTILAIFK